LDDQHFREEVAEARKAIIVRATARLAASTTKAADTLRKLLKSTDERIQLWAARVILTQILPRPKGELELVIAEPPESEFRIAGFSREQIMAEIYYRLGGDRLQTEGIEALPPPPRGPNGEWIPMPEIPQQGHVEQTRPAPTPPAPKPKQWDAPAPRPERSDTPPAPPAIHEQVDDHQEHVEPIELSPPPAPTPTPTLTPTPPPAPRSKYPVPPPRPTPELPPAVTDVPADEKRLSPFPRSLSFRKG
jgi:hypothetical protein